MAKWEVKRTALTEYELTTIANKQFSVERLAIVPCPKHLCFPRSPFFINPVFRPLHTLRINIQQGGDFSEIAVQPQFVFENGWVFCIRLLEKMWVHLFKIQLELGANSRCVKVLLIAFKQGDFDIPVTIVAFSNRRPTLYADWAQRHPTYFSCVRRRSALPFAPIRSQENIGQRFMLKPDTLKQKRWCLWHHLNFFKTPCFNKPLSLI